MSTHDRRTASAADPFVTAPAEPASSIPGAEAIAQSLKAAGIEMVFGYTGGASSAFTPALFLSNMPNIGGRTETTASWMSYGYNRVKRRAASAVMTWAVGSLHTSPIVYAAKLDSTPLMMISIDNPPSFEARDLLQDSVEMYSVMKPISKYIKKVTDAGDLPVIIRQAVKEASTGRFGPSFLAISQPTAFQKTSMKIEPLTLPAPPSADPADIAAVWKFLTAAERPVLYVGAGVQIADAAAELRELAELLGVPVVSTSWGGRGILVDDHPLYCGPSGNFGWRGANDTLQQADFWLAIGLSFSQMSTGSWSLKKPNAVVHVDIDQHELAKIFQPSLGIQSDAKKFLSQLVAYARNTGAGAPKNKLESWRAETAKIKEEWLVDMRAWVESDGPPINQYFLIDTLSKELPDDALVVADSGAHAFAFYRFYNYRTSMPLAMGSRYMSLGAGLPVAIGAKLADPSRTVVCYHGDGGFYYDFMELSNLHQHNLKLIVVLDNNRCLLANRAGARMRGVPNPWADLPDTDFVTVARGMGVEGERVDRPEDLAPAIRRALAAERSYFLDVRTDPDMRLVRAIKDMIPIVGDRVPKAGHTAIDIEGSWPS